MSTKDITYYKDGMKHIVKNVPDDAEITILSPALKHAVHVDAPYRSRRCPICKCCSLVSGDCLGGCDDGQKHKRGVQIVMPLDAKEFWPWRLIRGIEIDTYVDLMTDNCTPKEAADGLRAIADWLLARSSSQPKGEGKQ